MTPDDFLRAHPVPGAFIGADGRVLAINPALETLFGAQILGRHYMTAFRQPALLGRFEAAIETGTVTRGRYHGRVGGHDVAHEVTISPVDGGGWLAVFEDVTHLEEAGERRSEFVANVSHELRTPLTAISGFIETLRGPARDDAEARERFLEIMDRETRRMHRLVDDLLSLARVEEVERERPVDDVDLAALVSAATTGLRPLAEDRRVALALHGAEVPLPVAGDYDQLIQVFTNLIENAIKYGREGGTVAVTLAAVDAATALRGPGVSVAVADDGEGIEARHLGRLTERFYRVDSHRSRGMGGTGLGLAIVKHIVNRHRGRLRIDSTPGQGSTFTVYLPRT